MTEETKVGFCSFNAIVSISSFQEIFGKSGYVSGDSARTGPVVYSAMFLLFPLLFGDKLQLPKEWHKAFSG